MWEGGRSELDKIEEIAPKMAVINKSKGSTKLCSVQRIAGTVALNDKQALNIEI